MLPNSSFFMSAPTHVWGTLSSPAKKYRQLRVYSLLSVLLLLCAHPLLALGETIPANSVAYVSADEIRITLRRSPGEGYQAVKVLKAGMRLKVLETNDKGWTHVLTDDRNEGWILQRFISQEVPAKSRIGAIEDANLKLSSERKDLASKLENLEKATRECSQNQKELADIKSRSHNFQTLDQSNKFLTSKVEQLEKEFKRVSEDKRLLEKQSDSLFFLSGAVVLLLGLVGGFVLSRRRRSSYGTLD